MHDLVTAVIVIVILHFALMGFTLIALLVEGFGWLTDIYEHDDVESYIKRGLLALFMFPVFLVCTVAYRAYMKKRDMDKCGECLYRIAAEKGEKQNNGNKREDD